MEWAVSWRSLKSNDKFELLRRMALAVWGQETRLFRASEIAYWVLSPSAVSPPSAIVDKVSGCIGRVQLALHSAQSCKSELNVSLWLLFRGLMATNTQACRTNSDFVINKLIKHMQCMMRGWVFVRLPWAECVGAECGSIPVVNFYCQHKHSHHVLHPHYC